jgi:hypothetical protein
VLASWFHDRRFDLVEAVATFRVLDEPNTVIVVLTMDI